MKLYERDYSSLTDAEISTWESLKKQEVVGKLGKFEVTQSLFREYPKSVRHFISIFPNNYLDTIELQDESNLRRQVEKFQQLLDAPNASERSILGFIKQERSYFIIGSLLKRYYRFGHHDAFLFHEFPLGNSHKVDYLLVGGSSDGWQFVFVELESPYDSAVLANGELGLCFRKGIAQISDWDAWLDGNYGSLKEIFYKCLRPNANLPAEFINLDKSRLHFAVVAGRRHAFSAKTYRQRRKKIKDSAQLILHYDNLIDAAKEVIGSATY